MMHPRFRQCALAFTAAFWALQTLPSLAVAAKPELEQEYREKVAPLLKKFCIECHGDETAEGDLSLQGYKSAQAVLEGRKTWFKVIARISGGEMPPKEAKARPTKEEIKYLCEWIDATVNDIDCSGSPDPGKVTIRRLNRHEYRNTIRDLFGIDYKPAGDFPADDVGYGFDNIGDVLSLSPILLEKYLAAAEEITGQAIRTKEPLVGVSRKFTGRDLRGAGERSNDDRSRSISSNGEISTQYEFPQDGEYLLKARAYAQQAGDEAAKMSFRIDGKDEKTVDVPATADKVGIYEQKVRVKGGSRKVGLAFVNDYYMPDAPDPKDRDRNLIVVGLEIEGPLDAKPPEPPESHKKILFVRESADLSRREVARKILERQASRAYRRPATEAELDRLMKIFNMADERKENFETCIQISLQAILVSPHFLFKVELNTPAKPGELDRQLTDYELATSLSYFLWSSMPDDELFRAAWQGELRKGNNLDKQIRRMLADPKSQALVDNFAVQWLQLRNLDTITPDKGRFPTFDDKLRRAMFTETEMFFAAIMRDDRSVLELLSADFTFVNEQLAQHYGIEGIKGDEFRRVSLAGSPRGGVLTQASVLTVTSNPTRTSPVKRGKWVLENLLGTPPPPPAPDVPELKPNELTGTLRQQMEQHRANPACATCHKQMDVLGFSLENFDAIGGWRTSDGKFPIDPSGELPDGSKIGGPQDMKALLVAKRKDDFVRCLSEKMLTYALGRGLEYYDKCTLDKIAASLEKNDYRFSTLVAEVVKSDPFQKRRLTRP